MRLQKGIALGAVVLVALVLIGIAFFSGGGKSNVGMKAGQELKASENVSVSANINNSNAMIGNVSQNELAKHNTLNDCWVSYKGKVYDITSWLPKHPGTAGAILPYCGSSSAFEQAFTAQHGTTKAGFLVKVGVFMGDFSQVSN